MASTHGLRVYYVTVQVIVDWTVDELVSMDRRTRETLAMNGCMHTRSNIARLYLKRIGINRLC